MIFTSPFKINAKKNLEFEKFNNLKKKKIIDTNVFLVILSFFFILINFIFLENIPHLFLKPKYFTLVSTITF